MSVKLASADHEAMFSELAVVVAKYESRIPEDEMMCILANFLGKIVGLQDKNKYTPTQCVEMVMRNLEIGNQQLMAEVAAGRLTPGKSN